MEKIELTEEKLNELKKQTKDKFAYLLIEDLKGRLSSKKYKEAYKQLAFDRILTIIEKEKTRNNLKINKFINFNQIIQLNIIKGNSKKINISINGNTTLKKLSYLIQKEFKLEPL